MISSSRRSTIGRSTAHLTDNDAKDSHRSLVLVVLVDELDDEQNSVDRSASRRTTRRRPSRVLQLVDHGQLQTGPLFVLKKHQLDIFSICRSIRR